MNTVSISRHKKTPAPDIQDQVTSLLVQTSTLYSTLLGRTHDIRIAIRRNYISAERNALPQLLEITEQAADLGTQLLQLHKQISNRRLYPVSSAPLVVANADAIDELAIATARKQLAEITKLAEGALDLPAAQLTRRRIPAHPHHFSAAR